jgi:hypothetical protein
MVQQLMGNLGHSVLMPDRQFTILQKECFPRSFQIFLMRLILTTCHLCLLDLSATLDTGNHTVLLTRLEKTFGLTAVVQTCLASYRYLLDRQQSIWHVSLTCTGSVMSCGLPQVSVLRQIPFILYTTDIGGLLSPNNLNCHLYADDSQDYGFCKPHNTGINYLLRSTSPNCIAEIANCM